MQLETASFFYLGIFHFKCSVRMLNGEWFNLIQNNKNQTNICLIFIILYRERQSITSIYNALYK